MIFLKKQSLLLIILYVLFNICNIHIANCEGLTDVCNQDLSKLDKTIGWTLLVGSIIYCGYLLYKGTYPAGDLNPNVTENLDISTLSILGTLANEGKISPELEQSGNLSDLQKSEYLKSLQILVRYY